MRRTFIVDADVMGVTGELLVTLYDDGMTVAYREKPWFSWGPPMIARETE